MKKLFAVIIAIFIIAALCACEANPDPQSPTSTYRTGDTITIYVAKQDYDFGDPVVKSMFDAVEVEIENGYVTENGTIITPEQLRTEPIITDKNWSAYVSGSTCVYPEMQKGEIFLPINCIDRHECTFDDVLYFYNMVREYYEQRIILGNNEELTEDKYGADCIEKHSLTLKYNEKYTPLIRSCNDLHGYIRSFGSNWGKTESEIYAILVNVSNAIIDLGDECGYDVSAVKNWKYEKENWWGSSTPNKPNNLYGQLTSIPSADAKGYLTVHYIDVGYGDSILIACDGRTMLIDAGENGNGDTIVSYLNDLGITELDLVVGSHAHSDHIGGLDKVLNAIPAKKVWYPDYRHGTKTEEKFLTAAKNCGATICQPDLGETYALGGATVTVLGPVNNDYTDPDDMSIILMVQYGENKFLFTGSVEHTDGAETDLVAYWGTEQLKADVLKVSRHGSDTSSSYNFLQAVRPSYAVISVGEGNKYGHPKQDTLSNLGQVGIEALYRTDKNGTIIAVADGKDIKFAYTKKPSEPTGKTYEIIYDANGGLIKNNKQTVRYGTPYKLEIPTREGYSFAGWYNGETRYYEGTWHEANNVKLKAKWEINTYRISYVNGGGDHSNPNTYTIEDEIELAAPTKTGYTFIGWTCDEETTPVLDVRILKGSTGNKRFVANWRVNSYEISYDANGGFVTNTKQTINYGDLCKLETPTKKGYTFAGWYNGETKYYEGIWYETNNITLKAKWNINSYYVSIKNTSGGTINGKSGNYAYNSTIALSTNTMLGYTWLGWYDTEDNLISRDASYTFILDDANVSLVAKWRISDDIADFRFSSTETTCTIVDVIDDSKPSYSIPPYVTNIGNWAFFMCDEFTEMIIPNSVVSVGDVSFSGCDKLTTVKIPQSVTYIGSSAFSGCDELTDIIFEGSISEWETISLGQNWNFMVPATKIVCTDGIINLK